MTVDQDEMIEEYVEACLREGELLGVAQVNESDEIDFSEGPIYTHFGGMDEFQFSAFVAALSWPDDGAEALLEEYGRA